MTNPILNSNSQIIPDNPSNRTSTWSLKEEVYFKAALLWFETEEDKWRKIAEFLPGKSVDDVVKHYETLKYDDIRQIERICPAERKKSKRWTIEEHRLFLQGLEIYGRGDWKNISRNCVKSRTPTQIASHAQKYFKRQGKERKGRPSILDITNFSILQGPDIHGVTNDVVSLAIPHVSNIIITTECSTVPQRVNVHNMPEAANNSTNPFAQRYNIPNTLEAGAMHCVTNPQSYNFYNNTSPIDCSTVPQWFNLHNTPEAVNHFTTTQPNYPFSNITSPLDYRMFPQRFELHNTSGAANCFGKPQHNFQNYLIDPQSSNFHITTSPQIAQVPSLGPQHI